MKELPDPEHASGLPLPLQPLRDEPDLPVARPIQTAGPSSNPAEATDPFRLRSSRGSAWLDMLAFVVCIGCFRVGSEIGLTQIAPHLGLVAQGTAPDSQDMQRAVIVPVLFLTAIATRIVVGAILRSRGQSWASVGLTRDRLGMNCAIGLVATGAAYLLIFAGIGVMYLIRPTVLDDMHRNAENLTAAIPKMSPAVLALLSLTIGYYEELVFRGFLMTRLRHGTGSWIAAVILTTALFTALHASVQLGPALVAITTLSVVFSVTTVLRRSCVPAIVAHATFDFSQFMLLYITSGDAWK